MCLPMSHNRSFLQWSESDHNFSLVPSGASACATGIDPQKNTRS